jgi:phosphoglycolate phosphatase
VLEPIGLIFDLDGTLIDSAPDIHATANKVFTAHGLQPFDFATVRGFIGNGVGVLVARLMAHQSVADTDDLQSRMVLEFISLYEEAVDKTSLYPNVRQALETLGSKGHRMAICTNKPAAPALSVLRHFDLAHHFEVIVGGDTLPQRKPDPAPLLLARARLGPARVLFVGDSEVDAETAHASGVPLALFTEGYRKSAVEELGAKAIFSDFDALPGLVSHLSNRL